VVIATAARAAELGLRPVARFRAFAVVGVDPILMLTGPIPATAQVLAKAGLSLDEIGVFEVNEAFSSVVLAWLRETGADPAVVNPNGGAMALGHPLGASGARLLTTMAHHMTERGIRYGLQTMCEGGGMANAMVLELA
jgi:acetyl-CoA acyltransferase